MARRTETAPNMFAVLEHQERTAHFPTPFDMEACVSFFGQLVERYNAAMLAADTDAALRAKDDFDLFCDHYYAPHKDLIGVCHHDKRVELAHRNVAPEGTFPMWGQMGTFVVTVADVPVQVTTDCLGGIGQYGENLLPHFEIRIVDKARPFLSGTGYRSFFATVTDTEPGLTMAEAITRILTRHFEIEMKGRLEKYDPYRGYSPKFRRERMIADGIIPADAEEEIEPTEETTPVEDDDLMCDGCDAPLTMVDEYTETQCGTFCTPCRNTHNDACDTCAAEGDDDDSDEEDEEDGDETAIPTPVPTLQHLVFHVPATSNDSQFALF